jgi:hypothetical protein
MRKRDYCQTVSMPIGKPKQKLLNSEFEFLTTKEVFSKQELKILLIE